MTTLLVLASAALHALWNALLKRERDKDAAVVAVLAVAATLAALAATVEGAAAARVPFGDRAALGWSAAAGLFEAGYFITLAMALERAPLGLAYTVSRGAAILAVWPVSAFWLGEPVSASALAGSAVLLAGLLVAGLQRGAGRAGVALACLCAGFIAGYHLCYKRAMAGEPSAPAVFAVALAVALPVSLARLGPRRWPWRPRWPDGRGRCSRRAAPARPRSCCCCWRCARAARVWCSPCATARSCSPCCSLGCWASDPARASSPGRCWWPSGPRCLGARR